MENEQSSRPTGDSGRVASATRRRSLSPDDYLEGIRSGDRSVLSRALTLVESERSEDRRLAQELLVQLLPFTGKAHRVGISGVPGAGKSTLIETLGARLTARGRKVAVLAVDPTSSRTGGSILADKTRMPKLATNPRAFVRPSPSGGSSGGVASRTRESMLVLEAAGYEVLLVETVGVGQGEVAVASMVDSFAVLLPPGAGDELQGIKRGILELVDVLAITKADGEERSTAERTRLQFAGALRLTHRGEAAWRPSVVALSAVTGEGVDDFWARLEEHRRVLEDSGELRARRRRQRLRWMWELVEGQLVEALRRHPTVQRLRPELERAVLEGRLTPADAANRLLEAFGVAGRSGEGCDAVE